MTEKLNNITKFVEIHYLRNPIINFCVKGLWYKLLLNPNNSTINR